MVSDLTDENVDPESLRTKRVSYGERKYIIFTFLDTILSDQVIDNK
jgi:hypothetical protein